MHRLIFLFLSFSLITSCQTNRKNSDGNGRQVAAVATGEVWHAFIKQFSQKSHMSEEAIEKTMIKYFQNKVTNQKHGNHVSLGISDDQVYKIKTLTDDLPYMPKVRKWGMENMDKIFPKIKRSLISDVYENVVVGSRGVTNRYNLTLTRSSITNARRKRSSPFRSITEKQSLLLSDIRKIENQSIETNLRRNLLEFNKRGKKSPSIHANGQEIVESASLISQKTGHKAMGEGCKEFTQSASKEVIEIKANVDLYRAKLIEARAYKKNNGRSFASVHDVPKELRLSTKEIDDATKDAFKKVLGYSDDEARSALTRLKTKPCRLY
jgi:hypothetical protein